MKRKYKKPVIMVENFILSESIASCGDTFGNNMDVDEFLKDVEGFTGYFAENNCRNAAEPDKDYTFEGITLCYHTSSNVVFSS